jgi:L-aspartate oxidase
MAPGMAIVDSDVVIVGTGIAGLSAALAAVPARVTLVTKTTIGAGSSQWAQGGIAAAVDKMTDSPELHASDTVAVGVGLNDPDAVRILTTEGPERTLALVGLGARFDRADDGSLALGREAAHSARRVLHAGGDATGAEVVRALAEVVARHDAIRIVEHGYALDVVLDAHGRAAGVLVMQDGEVVWHRAPAVILAAGGAGQLYAATTNPPEATADGIAMALRAGAVARDLEFVQFHPTALAAPGADPLPLVTEALRGEGAILVDESGGRFVDELLPRDVVARAIVRHRLDGHGAFLDAREAVGDRFPTRFPTVWAGCQRFDIDPRREPIPVSPAAHYLMGGVVTDMHGRSTVEGLWAAGETANTGVHGANRLASNSLLEGLVFGARAGADAADAGRAGAAMAAPVTVGTDRSSIGESRRIMWRHVGLLRDAAGLTAAVDQLDTLAEVHRDLAPEAANLLLVSRAVTAAALQRAESRGGHHRLDFPDTDPAWAHHLDVTLDQEGAPTIAATQVVTA